MSRPTREECIEAIDAADALDGVIGQDGLYIEALNRAIGLLSAYSGLDYYGSNQ